MDDVTKLKYDFPKSKSDTAGSIVVIPIGGSYPILLEAQEYLRTTRISLTEFKYRVIGPDDGVYSGDLEVQTNWPDIDTAPVVIFHVLS